jgi:hypothetical protein
MDDPGAAQNAYLESWRYAEISKTEWEEIAKILKEANAKMSVAYVTGWLDDGNNKLGKLFIDGKEINNRVPGKVYSSMLVKYYHNELKKWYECKKQFEYLKSSDQIELELHGHTHISPDIKGWLTANDRYSNANWYREFLNTQTFPFSQQPFDIQQKIIKSSLEQFENFNVNKPWVIVPPGHKISYNTAKAGFELDIPFLSDYSLTISRNRKQYRCNLIKTHDGALKKYDTALKENKPITMMIHDKDIAIGGVKWFKELIDQLRIHKKKVITLKELYFKLAVIPKIKYNISEKSIILNFNPSIRLLKHINKHGLKLEYQLRLPKNKTIQKLPNNIELDNENVIRITLDGNEYKKEIKLSDI